jgi:hypothetical protein
MDTIFHDLILTNEVMVYMDNILIATDNDLTHHHHLVHQVLQNLEEHDLFLKPQKCQFEVDKVEYLSVILGHRQVRMDLVKVQGVREWPTPHNLKDVHGFLGFCNFYCRFIWRFSALACPGRMCLRP